MEKILLVSPRPLEFEMLDNASIPFSVLYLGTWLKHNGFDVEVVDGVVQPTTRAYEERVLEAARDCVAVGFSVMTPHVKDALDMTKKVKAAYPQCATLWGGVHPTLFADQTLRHPAIDFVMYGEGEDNLLELMRQLSRATPDLAKVPGLGYKVDGRSRMTAFGKAVEVSKLPFPDYSLLAPLEPYVAPRNMSRKKNERMMHRFVGIHCGRGCPYDCSFCINTVFDEGSLRRHRAFSAQRTYEEMKWWVDHHGVTYFGLQDELFFVNRPRLEELVGLFEQKPLNVRWTAAPRINYFNEAYIGKKFLRRLKDSGFNNFAMSIESGSDRVLSLLRKNVRKEQAVEAFRNQREAGIEGIAGFMIGIPGEEVEDMYQSLSLAIELYRVADGHLAYVGPQIFRPYPGAGLFETARKMGLKSPDNLEDWAKLAVNPMFGFLDVKYLPWLDDEKRRHINFIIKYVTVVLGARLDRNIFKFPVRMIVVAVPLLLLLKLRIRFGILDRYWLIERTVLNAVTPVETLNRRLKLYWRKIKLYWKEDAETLRPKPA